MFRPRDFVTALGVIVAILSGFSLFSLAPASAASANISRSYQASVNIPNGSIVSLDPKRPDFVQPANTVNANRLLGVALPETDSLIAINVQARTVQVATSGNVSTLVNTLNGDINVGDRVAVSPFNGVGMKAYAGTKVIGVAQSALSASSEGSASVQVTDKNGKLTKVRVGYIRLNIASGATLQDEERLNSLQKLAKAVTGHRTSTLKIVISLIIFIVASLSLVTFIYASIYGSIISIGRNPLAKYAVFRSLGYVMGMSVLMSVVAGLTIFFLLR